MEVFVCTVLIVISIWFVVSKIKQHNLQTRVEDHAKEFLKDYQTRFGMSHGRARDSYRIVIESVLRKQSSLGNWATRLTDLVFDQNDYIRNHYMYETLHTMPERFHQMVTVAIRGIIEGNTLTEYLKIADRPDIMPNWRLSPRNRQKIGEIVVNIIPNTL